MTIMKTMVAAIRRPMHHSFLGDVLEGAKFPIFPNLRSKKKQVQIQKKSKGPSG
jgi:hypothetical protein